MEKTHKVYGDIKVIELLNNRELHEEGELMKHCVNVYDKRCFQRKSLINCTTLFRVLSFVVPRKTIYPF